MDFINKALAQLGDLFRSMTPAARMTTVLLLVVIVVSVAFLFNHQFSGSDCYLFGGDPVLSSEVAGMTAAFGKAGLSEYELEGNRIKVPRAKQDKYMAALADNGALPHNFLSSLKKSLEDGGMFVDRRKREELVKVGMQDELSKIISKMNGIEYASVLYDIQTEVGLNPRKVITASAQVKPLGAQSLSPEQVQMIRNVVAPAIGASPEIVAVVDLNGHTYPGALPGQSGDVSGDRYFNTKHEYERAFTDRISSALSYVKNAVVSVNVELNTELEEVENSTHVDPKTVPVDRSESSKTLNSTASQPSGRPGVQGQGGVNAPLTLSASGGTKSEDESNTVHEKNAIGGSRTEIRRAGLTPKRVTVSVGVPSSYYDDIWQQRNPTPPGGTAKKPDAAAIAQIETDEQSKIQKYVLQQLPQLADPAKDATPLVTVTTFQHIPVAEIPKPSTADHAVAWLTDHASSLGMGVLGLVSLLMVRSIVRSVPATTVSDEPELNDSAPAAVEAVEDEPEEPTATPRLRRRRSKSGPSLRDELVEIVRDDPDAAANILRNWIGTAN